ncbi:hypothetical protein GCM10010377_74820 [Streptomyces viridiviolaceus]|nr:hypothetical protein GCM10010377_74820 [Streptomyces viridiviolaceus]
MYAFLPSGVTTMEKPASAAVGEPAFVSEPSRATPNTLTCPVPVPPTSMYRPGAPAADDKAEVPDDDVATADGASSPVAASATTLDTPIATRRERRNAFLVLRPAGIPKSRLSAIPMLDELAVISTSAESCLRTISAASPIKKGTDVLR